MTDGTFTALGAGAVARPTDSKLADFISVLDFIPVHLHAGIKSRTNTEGLASYIEAALAAHKHIYFPSGTYLIDDPDGDKIGFEIPSGRTIRGEGGNETILQTAGGTNAHLINLPTGTYGVGIFDMRLDGQRGENSVGHTLRMAGVSRVTVRGLQIINAGHYGIGIQGGTNQTVIMQDLVFWGSGGDAIDIKNLDSKNEGIFIDKVHIWSFGVNSSLESDQAGIDIRGPAQISNVYVEGVNNDLAGIRFRYGETNAETGFGGHYSNLTNFFISCSGTGIGVDVGARHVKISNGHVKNGARGIQVYGAFASISNVSVEGATVAGFDINSQGAGQYFGSFSSIVGCTAVSCATGFYVHNGVIDVTVLACTARSNTGYGAAVNAAKRTQLLYNNFLSNTAGGISNGDSTTVLVGNKQ